MQEARTGGSQLLPGTIQVTLSGKQWTLLRPSDLETLWDQMAEADFTDDERLPYWVELWPASLALAEFLIQKKQLLCGAVCADLGCGLGFTAMHATSIGAHVVAIDYEQDALQYARKNAVVNDVPQPCWTVMDWRVPAVRKQAFSYIWAGDIIYESRFITPVCSFLEYALQPEGIIWVAEPARNIYTAFQQALESRGWKSVKVAEQKVAPLHIQKHDVSVNIWEISRR